MNKVMKLVSVLLMVVMMTTVFTTVSLAAKGDIDPSTLEATYEVDTSKITKIGTNILGVIRNIAAVLLVVLIAILGIKFMMGSTEEKAEYKKSFMPLIIGTIIVLLSTWIGGFIWSTFSAGL